MALPEVKVKHLEAGRGGAGGVGRGREVPAGPEHRRAQPGAACVGACARVRGGRWALVVGVLTGSGGGRKPPIKGASCHCNAPAPRSEHLDSYEANVWHSLHLQQVQQRRLFQMPRTAGAASGPPPTAAPSPCASPCGWPPSGHRRSASQPGPRWRPRAETRAGGPARRQRWPPAAR